MAMPNEIRVRRERIFFVPCLALETFMQILDPLEKATVMYFGHPTDGYLVETEKPMLWDEDDNDYGIIPGFKLLPKKETACQDTCS